MTTSIHFPASHRTVPPSRGLATATVERFPSLSAEEPEVMMEGFHLGHAGAKSPPTSVPVPPGEEAEANRPKYVVCLDGTYQHEHLSLRPDVGMVYFICLEHHAMAQLDRITFWNPTLRLDRDGALIELEYLLDVFEVFEGLEGAIQD